MSISDARILRDNKIELILFWHQDIRHQVNFSLLIILQMESTTEQPQYYTSREKIKLTIWYAQAINCQTTELFQLQGQRLSNVYYRK